MKQRIGHSRTTEKPPRSERRATEDTGGVPFRPPSTVLPAQEATSQRARREYMARYLRIHHRRERWLARAESRYLPFRDAAGDVLILVGVPCALPSTQSFRAGKHYSLPTLRPGRIYRLHWTRAASLEAGHLAELVEVSPPPGERHPAAWGWTTLMPPVPSAQADPTGGARGSVQHVERLLKTISRALPED